MAITETAWDQATTEKAVSFGGDRRCRVGLSTSCVVPPRHPADVVDALRGQ